MPQQDASYSWGLFIRDAYFTVAVTTRNNRARGFFFCEEVQRIPYPPHQNLPPSSMEPLFLDIHAVESCLCVAFTVLFPNPQTHTFFQVNEGMKKKRKIN